MLTRILTEPRNALVPQYKALLGMDKVELSFTDDALSAIAKMAMERQTGARGLKAIMVCFFAIHLFFPFLTRSFIQESLLLDIMFEVPGSDVKSVHITEDCVKGLCGPQYNRNSANVTNSNSNSNNESTQSATSTTPSDEEESTQVRVTQ